MSNSRHVSYRNRDFINITDVNEIEQATDETMTTSSALSKLLGDQTAETWLIVLYLGVNAFLCTCGIVTNIINTIVFMKQGFEDSINISLLGLAIADLGCSLTVSMLIIFYNPFMYHADVPFIADDVGYLIAAWPRILFVRVTSWITAFITFERCLCITMPLKVKMIITTKRTQIVIAMIFILQAGSVMPQYFTSFLVWKFSPERNRTVLGLGFSEDRKEIDNVVFIVCNAILPMLAFVIVVICTVILSVKLKKIATWRERSVKIATSVSNKDQNIIRMVSFISTIFIICFTPNVIVFLGMSYEPELSIDGAYKNTLKVIASSMVVFESVNSSINFFWYMKMSSKFRATFHELLRSSDKLNQKS